MLFDAVIFTAAAVIIPEGWILSRLLGMLGFGPAGPVKGESVRAEHLFGALTF